MAYNALKAWRIFVILQCGPSQFMDALIRLERARCQKLSDGHLQNLIIQLHGTPSAAAPRTRLRRRCGDFLG
jgi:hypothetical protein